MAARARLLASILLLCACGVPKQQWFRAGTVDLQQHSGLLYKGDLPFTGSVFELDAAGRDTVSVVSFRNGREDGQWRRYYPGGGLAERREFANGMKTGILESWWENGRAKLRYQFADNEYEGPCREWNRDGVLVSEMNYHRGYEEGRQAKYYDNGKVRSNYVVRAGRRFGLLGTKNCVNVSDSVFKN